MSIAEYDEYYKHYDIETKTQTLVYRDEVVHTQTFKECPYVWFGELKDQIEAGEIVFVAWKMMGMPAQMTGHKEKI
jgi:hypothetical protein